MFPSSGGSTSIKNPQAKMLAAFRANKLNMALTTNWIERDRTAEAIATSITEEIVGKATEIYISKVMDRCVVGYVASECWHEMNALLSLNCFKFDHGSNHQNAPPRHSRRDKSRSSLKEPHQQQPVAVHEQEKQEKDKPNSDEPILLPSSRNDDNEGKNMSSTNTIENDKFNIDSSRMGLDSAYERYFGHLISPAQSQLAQQTPFNQTNQSYQQQQQQQQQKALIREQQYKQKSRGRHVHRNPDELYLEEDFARCEESARSAAAMLVSKIKSQREIHFQSPTASASSSTTKTSTSATTTAAATLAGANATTTTNASSSSSAASSNVKRAAMNTSHLATKAPTGTSTTRPTTSRSSSGFPSSSSSTAATTGRSKVTVRGKSLTSATNSSPSLTSLLSPSAARVGTLIPQGKAAETTAAAAAAATAESQQQVTKRSSSPPPLTSRMQSFGDMYEDSRAFSFSSCFGSEGRTGREAGEGGAGGGGDPQQDDTKWYVVRDHFYQNTRDFLREASIGPHDQYRQSMMKKENGVNGAGEAAAGGRPGTGTGGSSHYSRCLDVPGPIPVDRWMMHTIFSTEGGKKENETDENQLTMMMSSPTASPTSLKGPVTGPGAVASPNSALTSAEHPKHNAEINISDSNNKNESLTSPGTAAGSKATGTSTGVAKSPAKQATAKTTKKGEPNGKSRGIKQEKSQADKPKEQGSTAKSKSGPKTTTSSDTMSITKPKTRKGGSLSSSSSSPALSGTATTVAGTPVNGYCKALVDGDNCNDDEYEDDEFEMDGDFDPDMAAAQQMARLLQEGLEHDAQVKAHLVATSRQLQQQSSSVLASSTSSSHRASSAAMMSNSTTNMSAAARGKMGRRTGPMLIMDARAGRIIRAVQTTQAKDAQRIKQREERNRVRVTISRTPSPVSSDVDEHGNKKRKGLKKTSSTSSSSSSSAPAGWKMVNRGEQTKQRQEKQQAMILSTFEGLDEDRQPCFVAPAEGVDPKLGVGVEARNPPVSVQRTYKYEPPLAHLIQQPHPPPSSMSSAAIGAPLSMHASSSFTAAPFPPSVLVRSPERMSKSEYIELDNVKNATTTNTRGAGNPRLHRFSTAIAPPPPSVTQQLKLQQQQEQQGNHVPKIPTAPALSPAAVSARSRKSTMMMNISSGPNSHHAATARQRGSTSTIEGGGGTSGKFYQQQQQNSVPNKLNLGQA